MNWRRSKDPRADEATRRVADNERRLNKLEEKVDALEVFVEAMTIPATQRERR